MRGDNSADTQVSEGGGAREGVRECAYRCGNWQQVLLPGVGTEGAKTGCLGSEGR